MLRRVLRVCSLLLICGAPPALAQGRPNMPVTARTMVQLALNPAVLQELGIAKDSPVFADVTKLSQKTRAELLRRLQDARRADPNANPRAAAQTATAEYDAELKKLLTAEQYQRLREIQLQVEGHQALYDPEVIAALKLTDDQQKQIDAEMRDGLKKRAELLNRGEGIADVRKQLDEVIADWTKEVDQVLNKEQREKFDKLQNRDKLGFHDLLKDEIAPKLEITREQREKLETLQKDMRARQKKIYDAANARGSRVPEETQKKVREVLADQDQKIAGILTADQRKRLVELKGKPFDRSKLRRQPEPKPE